MLLLRLLRLRLLLLGVMVSRELLLLLLGTRVLLVQLLRRSHILRTGIVVVLRTRLLLRHLLLLLRTLLPMVISQLVKEALCRRPKTLRRRLTRKGRPIRGRS